MATCEKYNSKTGLCTDYENRPDCCRNFPNRNHKWCNKHATCDAECNVCEDKCCANIEIGNAASAFYACCITCDECDKLFGEDE